MPHDAPAPARPGWYDTFLEALRAGGVVTSAARAAGKERTTPYQARKRDSDFAREWDEAIEDSIDAVQLTAQRLATSGDDSAMTRWWLTRRRPGLFADRTHVELTGHVPFDPDADDELFKRLKHLAEVKQEQLDAAAERAAADA